MAFSFDPVGLTLTQYELAVKATLDRSGLPLEHFTSNHLGAVKGLDDRRDRRYSTVLSLGTGFLVLIGVSTSNAKSSASFDRLSAIRWVVVPR
jgi:hypothetical protein